MASIIDEAIPVQAHELIRDRIGEILAVELPRQATLNSDDNLSATVFIERFAKIDRSEGPVVNVTFEAWEELSKDATMQKNRYTFNVDCYHQSKATSSGRGDTLAQMHLQRLMGVCRGVINHSKYKTLAFDPPFIGWRSANKAQIQLQTEAQGAASMVMGRVVVTVEATQTELVSQGVLIKGWISTVKLSETDLGYVFTEFPDPNP